MAAPGTRGAWYHQPIVWLGGLLLVAMLAGCIHLIALATRHADDPLATAQPVLFGMPTAHPVSSGPPPATPGGAVQ